MRSVMKLAQFADRVQLIAYQMGDGASPGWILNQLNKALKDLYND